MITIGINLVIGQMEFLIHQLEIKDGYAYAPDRPGHGVEIDWKNIARHRVPVV